ncbi:MAG: hypothetical protein ACI9E5_001508, partial [Candidatus Omnitrophota bacterium]
MAYFLGMHIYNTKNNINNKFNIKLLIGKTCSMFVLIAFLSTSMFPAEYVHAQNIMATPVTLPAVGSLIHLSAPHVPLLINGLKVYPENPFKFDFLIDTGHDVFKEDDLRSTSNKLIKYFLAALTTPDKDFWVNLSPYEENRIIPENFGHTEMGRDLLAQDYILKQITASLMYPKDAIGADFWERIKERAVLEYGVSEMPLNTFNKVWVVPSKAVVYVHDNHVYVTESRLKLILYIDYLAEQEEGLDNTESSNVTNDIVREIIIPELEHEVNYGKHFAPLRQIYNTLILATWYKKSVKESLLSKYYVDQNKTPGVEIADHDETQKIYKQYLDAFKAGVFDFIEEEYDPVKQEIIPRKYFSGGKDFAALGKDILEIEETVDPAILDPIGEPLVIQAELKSVDLAPLTPERQKTSANIDAGALSLTNTRDLVEWLQVNYERSDVSGQHLKDEWDLDLDSYATRYGHVAVYYLIRDVKEATGFSGIISPQRFPGKINKFLKKENIIKTGSLRLEIYFSLVSVLRQLQQGNELKLYGDLSKLGDLYGLIKEDSISRGEWDDESGVHLGQLTSVITSSAKVEAIVGEAVEGWDIPQINLTWDNFEAVGKWLKEKYEEESLGEYGDREGKGFIRLLAEIKASKKGDILFKLQGINLGHLTSLINSGVKVSAIVGEEVEDWDMPKVSLTWD